MDFGMGAPDTGLFNWLFGTGAMAAPGMVPSVVPPVAAPGDLFGPPTPLVPAQSYEPTNITAVRPPPPPSEDYRSVPMPSLGESIGGSSTGVPLPRPRPADAPGPTTPGGGSDALLKTLQGVKAPAPPTPQRVSTPNLPPLRPIQGGQFFDMMAALGIGPQQLVSGMKLPGTLGQALGGK